MKDLIYFYAEIHYTRKSQLKTFWGKRETDYCTFNHLILAEDIEQAGKKAKEYGIAFFKDLDIGKFEFAKVTETII